MAREQLQDIYVEQLRDLYSAEQQILQALPRMADAASHRELRGAFVEHERVTRVQVERLEKIFDALGQKPSGHKCKGMEGLIEEGEDAIKKHDGFALDAVMIAAAQRVEHYEIAGYGCARTFAAMLGLEDQAHLLQQTLNEEGETDNRLTDLAERVVNIDAIVD
jgi:ferritin-like metal-binding protein YciE